MEEQWWANSCWNLALEAGKRGAYEGCTVLLNACGAFFAALPPRDAEALEQEKVHLNSQGLGFRF